MERTHVRRVGLPREVAVDAGADGIPVAVGRRRVLHLRDEWRVEEGWWTREPVRRLYYDLVLDDGRNAVVYRDRRRGRWYAQRG
jgi:hypothetical protein